MKTLLRTSHSAALNECRGDRGPHNRHGGRVIGPRAPRPHRDHRPWMRDQSPAPFIPFRNGPGETRKSCSSRTPPATQEEGKRMTRSRRKKESRDVRMDQKKHRILPSLLPSSPSSAPVAVSRSERSARDKGAARGGPQGENTVVGEAEVAVFIGSNWNTLEAEDRNPRTPPSCPDRRVRQHIKEGDPLPPSFPWVVHRQSYVPRSALPFRRFDGTLHPRHNNPEATRELSPGSYNTNRRRSRPCILGFFPSGRPALRVSGEKPRIGITDLLQLGASGTPWATAAKATRPSKKGSRTHFSRAHPPFGRLRVHAKRASPGKGAGVSVPSRYSDYYGAPTATATPTDPDAA